MYGKTPFDQYAEGSAMPLKMLAVFLGFIFSIIFFLFKISVLLIFSLIAVAYRKIKAIIQNRRQEQ